MKLDAFKLLYGRSSCREITMEQTVGKKSVGTYAVECMSRTRLYEWFTRF